MTLNEYKYRFLKTYGHENYGQEGCGGPILTGFMMILLMFLFCGCKTIKYVPFETIRTEIVHQHDTIKQTDSVTNNIRTIIRESRPEDSLMLRELGIKLQANERLLILLQKELQQAKSEKQESHNRDSVRVDSIQVPYPVEKPLTRWQTFCLDFGMVTTGGCIVTVIVGVLWLIRWIRKRRFQR